MSCARTNARAAGTCDFQAHGGYPETKKAGREMERRYEKVSEESRAKRGGAGIQAPRVEGCLRCCA